MEYVLSFLLQLAIVAFVIVLVVTCFGAVLAIVKKYWLHILIAITVLAYLFPSKKLRILPRWANEIVDVIISAAPMIIGGYVLYRCIISQYTILRIIGLGVAVCIIYHVCTGNSLF